MPRTKRPNSPVSDRWDHLWVSAVAGVALGSTQMFLLISALGFSFDPFKWRLYVGHALCGVLCALAIAISPKNQGVLERMLRLAADVVVCVIFAIVANTIHPAFNLLPKTSLAEFGSAVWSFVPSTLIAAALLRTIGAWTIILLGALTLRIVKRMRRRPPGFACRTCGFDQRGLETAGICPECGHPSRAEPIPNTSESDRIVRFALRLTVWTALAAWVVAQVPWFAVQWRYRSIHITKIVGETGWSSSVENIIEIQSAAGRTWWVGIAIPAKQFFMWWPTGLDCLETCVYDQDPSDPANMFQRTPSATEPGLMSGDTLRSLIDEANEP